jgi:hypothetical protein
LLPAFGSKWVIDNEEVSGIIPAPFLGPGKYLLDVRNHKELDDADWLRRANS